MSASLVQAEDLAARLGDDRLRLFDASFYLPTEPQDARALFREAHLPGARFFDVGEVADPDTDLPHMAPAAGRFSRMMQTLGVARDSRVVFYDQKGLFSAARGWWLMRLFGHGDVAVLDGGLPRWRALGLPLESGEPAAPAPPATPYVPALDTSLLAGLGDVRRTLDTREALVLDARAAERFAGAAPEPRPGVRAGHVPGARNLPFTTLLAPDGRMLPPAAVARAFDAVTGGADRPLIVSCGTGVTAAVLALGLETIGRRPPALYDGSWTEWGGNPDNPVETG